MNETTDDTKTQWRSPALVTIFGCLGGLTAWMWSITVGTPLNLATAGAIAANVFLGGVAGFVGTYAIKLDSSRVLMHSLALALLCGFAWKPTLEAGRELVITRMYEGEVAEATEDVRQATAALKTASPQQAPQLMEQVAEKSQLLLESADRLRDPQLRREVEEVLSDTVPALRDAADKAPEASAEALGTLGAAALREDRASLSEAASFSLLELAERERFEVGTSSEVSNSLLRLSAAARANAREDLAVELRRQSLEVVQQAEIEARQQDRPEAVRELRERAIVRRELRPPGG